MKIAFFNLESWVKDLIKKSFPNDNILFLNGNIKPDKTIDAISIFVKTKIDKKVLDNLPNLKLICTQSTGFDHINIKECKKRKITVCNVPNYGEDTIAEYTFALILALSKKIIEANKRVKEANFNNVDLRGFDLYGKILGIIGTGKIGENVIRIAKGFNMKILAYDIKKDQELAKKLGYKYSSINNLLKSSDIITIHVPYNKHTHHLIGREEFNQMKKNCLLINTARGGVIDTKELVFALKNKKIAGAGLDVLENECEFINYCKKSELYDYNCKLFNMNNVIVTPHNAYNTDEAIKRIFNTTIKNIKAFKNKRKINIV